MKWTRTKVTRTVFTGMGRSEERTWTEYRFVDKGGHYLGHATKTGSHLDNYPWAWETPRHWGSTGTLAEAKQCVEDALAGKYLQNGRH